MSEKKQPRKYFLSQISPYRPLKVTCPVCTTVTVFSSHIHLNTSEGSIHINNYQCQSCGKIETSDENHPDGVRVGLEKLCECGGQFRSDKNIFCPSCQYRKSEENKEEDKLFATEEEMEQLSTRHDEEEMLPGYKGEENVKETIEEESDMRKLFNALRELTTDGTPFKFGFSVGGKGGESFFDEGLDKDMQYLLYTWMNESLAPESNYHATDYELTFNGNTIDLECSASWGGWMYDNLHTYDEIFTSDVVELLLPDLDPDNVNLEELPLSFECTIDENGYDFSWGSDSLDYYDEETEENYDVSLDELKPQLEPLLNDNICDFDSGGSVDHEGSWFKRISVEPGEVTVEEFITFHLSFDIDEF
jgi:hypothetical protein